MCICNIVDKARNVQNKCKKPKRKIRSESRDIDENDIVQRLGETFGIFRRLAVEWRRIPFVYDVIENMAIATSVARCDSSHRKRRGIQKIINGNVSSEFISLWFVGVHGSCKFYLTLRLASSFTLTKSTRMVILQDVQSNSVTSGLSWPRTEVTISVREYPENYQN